MPEPLIQPKGDGPRFGKNLPKPRIVDAAAAAAVEQSIPNQTAQVEATQK